MVAHFNLEQGQWRLQWDDGLILPELAGGNVLKMDYQIPARGNIYDRTGLPIVAQSDAYALGITPGQMSGNSEGRAGRRAFATCATARPSRSRPPTPMPPRIGMCAICDASADETKGVLDLNAGGLTVTPYNSRYLSRPGHCAAGGRLCLAHPEGRPGRISPPGLSRRRKGRAIRHREIDGAVSGRQARRLAVCRGYRTGRS